jgi:2-iminobutanoate/2-iminopropanoate deaminase
MSKKIIKSEYAPLPIGPYSQAVRVGNTLFCSGQVALDPQNGNLVLDNITSETRQVMENLKAVLEEAEMEFSNVVKCSIFLKDMNDFKELNAVYGEYFKREHPARETVQVAALPLNVNVEISLIAIKD